MATDLKVGWREWVALPDLGVPAIKAKIDTGASTSALHAFRATPLVKDGVDYVRFFVHPAQRQKQPEVECIAPLLEQRLVRSSNGEAQRRFVIKTTLQIGTISRAIELTLTNRDEMSFRMLIGRQAMKNIVVSPDHSYLLGKHAPH